MRVYDVTTFLEDHPGGEDVLLHAAANGDATESFEEVGHSSTATSMMEGYFIGTLEGHAASSDSSSGAPSGGALRNKALLEKKQPPSSGFSGFLLPLLVLALAFAAWYYLTYINVKA
ncbi:uncharacterized protein A4U43_C02F5130 [Asparagus officinalis]|uniref:Cytochrome b5 heme-binding domain-containing protein n=1 Tax=Asparagus officinalis TaxID=4686 RepID=A0A5P1FKU0_ASPOF|nr:uncharacterized protein A4U43_C02F5130 [Asparagus officinalis]